LDGGTDTGIDAGDCPAEVMVTEEIDADETWACPVYVLSGLIFVTNDSTLTIQPGVTVLGDTAGAEVAALIISRGSQLNAVGTAAAPIVFTSGNPAGARATSDWGGVVLLGGATLNAGSCIMDGNPGTPECDAPGFLEGRIEGIDVSDDRARYGGTDDAGSCGNLEYVRIEFAGRELSPDNELNGLTVGGCGSGTALSFIQSHLGSDDGVEFFGGTAGVDHLIITGADDDSLDFDQGWRGQVQFLIVHQFPGLGDHGFEADGNGDDEDAEPRTSPTIFNATLIGTPDTRGMVLREGVRGTLRNFIITGFGTEAVDIRAAQVVPSMEWPASLSIANSYFFMNGAYEAEMGMADDDMGFDEMAQIHDAARNNSTSVDPMIADTSTTAPDYTPGAASAMLMGATPTFGDTTATYAGAVEPMAATSWTDGWTAFPAN
jgi:hypothetical protein